MAAPFLLLPICRRLAKALASERSNAMDYTINTAVDLDQTEEETLTYEVSDEALERAASNQGGRFITAAFSLVSLDFCSC
jgi:hypothetical protein